MVSLETAIGRRAYWGFLLNFRMVRIAHANAPDTDLLDLLVRRDMPLFILEYLAASGAESVAYLAYCVAADMELMEGVMGSVGELRFATQLLRERPTMCVGGGLPYYYSISAKLGI